ncbi:SpoIID/LytB domain-containing protein [Luteibaculum oceani]|nr:SpoIID/LytB domain-containing protein [Luteibaculum oceani]
MKFYICLISVFLTHLLWADDTLLISIYNRSSLQQVLINPDGAVYTVEGKDLNVSIAPGDWLRITKKEGAFHVQGAKQDFGLHRTLRIRASVSSSLLKVLPENPKKLEQWYGGNIRVEYTLKGLKLLNEVALEEYVAGVVQAESGVDQNKEYYKVQGIICRTFALSNINKHITEGFNLCDQTHCQVYHGKARAKSYIHEALGETQGKVLVDSNLRFIEAVFHSNCGGQTLNSEDYWRGSINYLRSKLDSLCENMPHWSWTFALESDQWLGYLKQKFNFPIHDTIHAYNAKNWHPQYRGKWFLNPGFRIPVRTIREDWRLRSTNFSVVEKDGIVTIIGTGFGHGVGLCQEGAMARSDKESFSDILHFYYENVYIVDKNRVAFYKKYK